MADISYDSTEATGRGMRAGTIVNLTGAALSLALVAGIGTWGYKLVMRDVTGVPVVKAMAGPMREAPSEPGGDIAMNTGLSVNTIAAEGEAAPPEDRLLLAPEDVVMTEADFEIEPDEDPVEEEGTQLASRSVSATSIPGTGKAETLKQASLAAQDDPDRPLSDDEVMALADQIAAGVKPLSKQEVDEATRNAVKTSLGGMSASEAEIIARSVPGVAASLRPQGRPAIMRSRNAAAEVTKTVAAKPMVDGQSVEPGTELVQLGAFESKAVAEQEWERLAQRFGDYMANKSPVVERAESGGRTFYRLRAMGFEDLSGARRFCSALVAEDAACIPVVAR